MEFILFWGKNLPMICMEEKNVFTEEFYIKEAEIKTIHFENNKRKLLK